MKKSRAVKIVAGLFGVSVLLMVLIALLDWNLLRPYINRKVSDSTGRDFAIDGNLDLKFYRGLDSEQGWRRYLPRPYISAERIRISNPAWSDVGPQMAIVQKVEVGLHILPLLTRHVVITDLRLDGPQLALQRRKDGSNTWTLKDNGPSEWDVDIQRLAFSTGQLRYVDAPIGLDLNAHAKSIAGAQAYGLEFELGGKYKKATISGGGRTGAVLTLTGEHVTLPVEAQARLGANRISLRGTVTDPRLLAGMDLQMTLGGASMADLYPLTGVLLPETPPYETHGRLLARKNGADWTFTYQQFTGKVGASDIAGTLEYAQRKPRATLRGELVSQQLRLADLGPTVGADTGAGTKQAGVVKAPPPGKALPVAQFNTAKWGALDADVKFSGKRIVRSNGIPLSDIVTTIRMQDKVLTLTPLDFGMAGGRITSNIRLDGRDTVIDAQARVAARHLKIRELFPQLQSMQASFGEVNGDAALAGKGNNMATMLGTSNGELNAVVTEGSVSKFVLELAGLNVANAVYVKLFGDKQVHLNCLAAASAVRNGHANIDRFVLDTDEAVIDVSGYVDLGTERLDLKVRPKTKGTRILSLRTPLYAQGTFADPKVGPEPGPLLLKGGAAVALAAVVNPLAALLPLVNVGRVPDTDCATEIRRAEKAPVMPKGAPGKNPTLPRVVAPVRQ